MVDNKEKKMKKILSGIVLLSICVWPMPSWSTIFINEFHYDNIGTDVGEAIEIAGLAGTDLSGWSIVLYNGNGGAPYNTRLLSGIIPNQTKGFGTLVFPYPQDGIQNGAPDGIALVDPLNNVTQFLSYEGSFIAVGGPANGMQSTDIGVFEDSSTPIGYSLQTTGLNASSNWSGSLSNTFGSLNVAQLSSQGAPAATNFLLFD